MWRSFDERILLILHSGWPGPVWCSIACSPWHVLHGLIAFESSPKRRGVANKIFQYLAVRCIVCSCTINKTFHGCWQSKLKGFIVPVRPLPPPSNQYLQKSNRLASNIYSKQSAWTTRESDLRCKFFHQFRSRRKGRAPTVGSQFEITFSRHFDGLGLTMATLIPVTGCSLNSIPRLNCCGYGLQS